MSGLFGQRAIVIGAGIGGLSIAGALANCFERVEVLERARLAGSVGPGQVPLRIGSPMLCWLAALWRSTNFSPASEMILLKLGPSRSGSHKTCKSSGQMSAWCRNVISDFRYSVHPGR